MKTPDSSTFAAACEFILREARLLEQRLFAALFEDGPADAVVDALRGYRNGDGGFGHGLEPEKLCPASLAIDVEFALLTMDAAGCPDRELIRGACGFLAGVSVDGAVPLAAPIIEKYPRAVHWSEWTYRLDVFPTAGLAGLLHRFGVEHPWLEHATRWCRTALETDLPQDAHAFGEALVFRRGKAAGEPCSPTRPLPRISIGSKPTSRTTAGGRSHGSRRAALRRLRIEA